MIFFDLAMQILYIKRIFSKVSLKRDAELSCKHASGMVKQERNGKNSFSEDRRQRDPGTDCL